MMPVLSHGARQQMASPAVDPALCAESNRSKILGVVTPFIFVGTIILALRIMVRSMMIKSVGADDYVMLGAWLMAVGTYVGFVAETEYAVGKHIQCITPPVFEMQARWQYFHSMWVMIGVVLVKISVALFLMRLVPPGRKWKHFLWAIIIFLICFCLACLGTLIFQCIPVYAAWDFAVRARPDTRCFSNSTFSAIGLMNSSINCATDFLLAIIPIPIIVKLQVNMRTKISLGLILSLGYVACAAGIVKAIKQHGFFDEKDPFWENSFNVWNMIELCVGIIAASLPALRPLFTKLLESTKSALTGGSWGSRSRTVIQGGGSNGHYRRQESRDVATDTAGDIKLHTWKDMSRSTGDSKIAVMHEEEVHEFPEGSKKQSATHPRAPPPSFRNSNNTECVAAGRALGDSSSWEDIEVLRSQSEETLNRQNDKDVMGIFKTLEITRRSESIEDADRGPRTMGIV